MLRILKWAAISLLLLVLVLLAPVGYIEAFCRADAEQAEYKPLITDPAFQRREANSYLTYPEWHIVYAYEGLAKVLETDDEHAFDYARSVMGFWTSFCALNRKANHHGGGDFNTRATVHTIGVSFSFEMGMKALYEESIGRLFALMRGSQKSPQDVLSAKMAADYAGFLQQVPWYKYDFEKATVELWNEPVEQVARGWERRLALGGEWKAKAAYAKVIAGAVAAAGQAQLRIRTVVKGMLPSELAGLKDVEVVDTMPDHVVIETPRYRRFTRILDAIAASGGEIVEIAGNDDIMLSAVEPVDVASPELQTGEVLSRVSRDGYDDSRLLIGTKLSALPALLAELRGGNRRLEHIYDY